jgi:hypothetical protein
VKLSEESKLMISSGNTLMNRTEYVPCFMSALKKENNVEHELTTTW